MQKCLSIPAPKKENRKFSFTPSLLVDLLEEREENDFKLVPYVVSQEVEQVVDGLPEVAATQQIVEVKFDAGKVGTDVHLRHSNKPILVDDDRSHGVQVQVVDLKPDVAVTVERDETKNAASQIVNGIALESSQIAKLNDRIDC